MWALFIILAYIALMGLIYKLYPYGKPSDRLAVALPGSSAVLCAVAPLLGPEPLPLAVTLFFLAIASFLAGTAYSLHVKIKRDA